MKLDLRPLLRGEVSRMPVSFTFLFDDIDGVTINGDVKVFGEIVDNAGYMRMTLEISFNYTGECARCLDPVNGHFSTEFERTVVDEGTLTEEQLENNVDEMLSLMKILQPEVAASASRLASISSAPQFRDAIASVYYRRKRADVLTELPELIETEEWCTLLSEEKKVYEDAVLSRNFAAARRVSWNSGDMSKSCKALRLKEIVEDAAEDNRKVIVFSFFLDTIQRVTELFGEKCVQPINGSVPLQRRQEIVDEFEKAPAGAVLPAQIQSGGTGLNIQSASVVIICEPQFKPSIENQAVSRAYRMGQTRNVLVYRLLCEDSVDERITEILKEKQNIFDAFADESSAAAESLEIDSDSFGNIIDEEIKRINKEHASEENKQ